MVQKKRTMLLSRLQAVRPRRCYKVAPMPEVLPILYSFRRCPYAMRARMALLVAGLPCVLREVELRAKPAAMLAASPKGTVPVLVLPQGEVLAESLDIMHWALARHDPRGWRDGAAAAQALIAACDGEFKHHLDRYKYAGRYPGADAADHRARAAAFVAALEARLAADAWLAGARPGLADAAVMPFVRQYAHTEAAWFAGQSWPRVQAWLAALEASALFATAMRKVAPWQPDQAPLRLDALSDPWADTAFP